MPETRIVNVPAYSETGTIMGDFRVEMSTECIRCKHLDTRSFFICKAFPEVIPKDIFTGKVSHMEPYEGDNGIQFEPFVPEGA